MADLPGAAGPRLGPEGLRRTGPGFESRPPACLRSVPRTAALPAFEPERSLRKTGLCRPEKKEELPRDDSQSFATIEKRLAQGGLPAGNFRPPACLLGAVQNSAIMSDAGMCGVTVNLSRRR